MAAKLYTPIDRAEVREHNGRPALFVNGEPRDGLTYMTYNPKVENFAKFDELGVGIMSFVVTCDTHIWESHAAPVCTGPEVYDYSGFDARMQIVSDAAPHAWLLPRVYVLPPLWWCEQHPDELVRFGEPRSVPRPGIDVENGRFVPSFASEQWRRFGSDNLARLVRHVEAGPWADRVLGYHIATGTTEEWLWWGIMEGRFPDYSPCMLNAFRAFLRERYRDEEALRAAWGHSGVSFDTAALPSLEERVRDGCDQIRDPAVEQNVIDYILCHSRVVVQTLSEFALAVKEAQTSPRITVAFSGYIQDQYTRPYLIHNAGVLAFQDVLDCPHLDAIASPSTYAHRAPRTGHSGFMAPGESVALHGKLWFDENDHRTHCPGGGGQPGFFATHDPHETICVQRRQFAALLQQGCAGWWFDMGGDWYDDIMHEEIERTVEIARRALDFDRSSTSEIAVVVDPKSLAYLTGAATCAPSLLSLPRRSFGRCGAPCDTILLSDLETARDYKLYAFLNVCHLTAHERSVIEQVVKRSSKTALWFHAAGYVADKPSLLAQKEVTGIEVDIHAGHMRPGTVIHPGDHPILRGLERNCCYGEDTWFTSPFFVVEDAEATPLGYWESDEHVVTMAAKEFDNWRSIWACAPNPPPWLVQNIARWAGVHIYNEADDALYANESILTLSVNEAGPRTLCLPRRTFVYELFDERREWENVIELEVHMPRQHTSIFFLGSRAEWEDAVPSFHRSIHKED